MSRPELLILVRVEASNTRNVVYKFEGAEPMFLGNAPHSDIKIEEYLRTSLKHALIHQVNDRWFIMDLSEHGTHLMGADRPEWDCDVSSGLSLPKGENWPLEVGTTWLMIGFARVAIKIIEAPAGSSAMSILNQAAWGDW
jgi:hypothetical protein